uniref:Uncharacterized protein n=1 Tax=Populus trichocarpa TaxID=3694 RepID=A0A2K1X096_POPTR
MSGSSWPSENELNEIKDSKPTMAGRGPEEERVVVSPCRICPLDARIDHQVLLIENEYLGLKNGILDQSAMLLSSHACLTRMNCKGVLEPKLAKRAEHYFSENMRGITLLTFVPSKK